MIHKLIIINLNKFFSKVLKIRGRATKKLKGIKLLFRWLFKLKIKNKL